MELGADDYIVKPFTSKELLGAIAARLEKRSAIQRQSEAKLKSLRSSITLSLPHELHTPLNGILGLSALLVEEHALLESAEILEMAKSIHTSGQRLYRLIQNFLLYAQLEITAADPEQVKILRSNQTSFSKVAIEEVVFQKVKLSHRGNDLQLELQDVAVQISESDLKKISEELIDNALKYSPTDTPIHVTGIQNINFFLLSVVDYGRGMTAHQITNLGAYMQFERRIYEQQGTGLGLVIAKRLAELHGGNLTIESVPEKQTIVRVALPL
jgi:signal transduction histidine kinase